MKKNYCWIIVVCCFLIQAATTGIYCNCTGLFTAQILNEFGFSNGSFAWAVTLRTLFSALSMMLCAKIYNEKTYKKIYFFFSIASALLWASQIFFNHLWQWYLQNSLLGFCYGFILTIPLNIILKNWFSTRLGFALGISMTASGVSGMIINPISSNLIMNYGWRYGIVFLSIVSVVLILPCVFFLLIWSPEQIGLEPYEGKDTKKNENKPIEIHANKKTILFAVVLGVCLNSLTQYVNSISVYVDSLGMDVTFAGLATSALMVGNLSGKIIIGAFADIIGTFRTLIINLICVAASFIIYIFFCEPVCIILASFFYGSCMSLASLAPGLVTQECVEHEKYGEVVGKMSSIGTFLCAAFYLVISYSYDLFNSFAPSFIISIFICIISIFIILFLQKQTKK